MDPVWIAVAFVLGAGARLVRLPPLVGFLAAGFVLHAFGVNATETLVRIGDAGVWLLLFAIGLKLDLRSLVRPEVLAGTLTHMGVTVVACTGVLLGLGVLGLPYVVDLDPKLALLVGFAMSFSSTVFAVKILDERGEGGSLHGRTAIGILIMQDVVAIVFLTVSTGKIPSPWALLLLGLPLVRPVLAKILDVAGHGELLVLLGLVLALGGAQLFDLLDLKEDLGALVLGLLVSSHRKAKELSESLLGFKDVFLVGFFLTIGLGGAPRPEAIGLAAVFLLLIPFKVGLFFVLLTRFRLRARTSLLSSLALANYSEFGLIVGTVTAGTRAGWIDKETGSWSSPWPSRSPTWPRPPRMRWPTRSTPGCDAGWIASSGRGTIPTRRPSIPGTRRSWSSGWGAWEPAPTTRWWRGTDTAFGGSSRRRARSRRTSRPVARSSRRTPRIRTSGSGSDGRGRSGWRCWRCPATRPTCTWPRC
jgi:glutathione-regulated potassium-efflux system ancillary protein KefC